MMQMNWKKNQNEAARIVPGSTKVFSVYRVGTKLGIVKRILQTIGSISLLVDDSFVPEDIISSVSVPQC